MKKDQEGYKENGRKFYCVVVCERAVTEASCWVVTGRRKDKDTDMYYRGRVTDEDNAGQHSKDADKLNTSSKDEDL